MVHTLVRDVQPRRAAVVPPRRAFEADDLLKNLDFFDKQLVVSSVATIMNSCRHAGWSFQDTFYEFKTACQQFHLASRGRRASEVQVRHHAHRYWTRLAQTSGQSRSWGQQGRIETAVHLHAAIDGSVLDNPNDLVLLHVLVDTAVTQMHDDATLSLTQLAEEVGIGRDTVIAAVRRCQEAGVLEVDRPGWDAQEHRWRANRMRVLLPQLRQLQGPAAVAEPDAPLSDRPGTSPLGGWAGRKLVHDVFTGLGSLRSRGRLLVVLLGQGGWSRQQLQIALKCGRNTLGRLVKSAVAVGIAKVVDGLVHLGDLLADATTDDEVEGILDCAADDLEVTGALQRLRERMQAHRAYLLQRATEISRGWDAARRALGVKIPRDCDRRRR